MIRRVNYLGNVMSFSPRVSFSPDSGMESPSTQNSEQRLAAQGSLQGRIITKTPVSPEVEALLHDFLLACSTGDSEKLSLLRSDERVHKHITDISTEDVENTFGLTLEQIYREENYEALITLAELYPESLEKILLQAGINENYTFLETLFKKMTGNPKINGKAILSILDAHDLILTSLFANNQLDAFREICNFANSTGALCYLKIICKSDDLYSYSPLDYAEAIGQQELVTILKELGVEQDFAEIPEGTISIAEKHQIIEDFKDGLKKKSFGNLKILHAQLFGSYDFEIAEIHQGLATIQVLMNRIAELVEYQKEVLTEAFHADVARVIQEVRGAIKSHQLSHYPLAFAAFNLQSIEALPPYSDEIPVDAAPCVLIAGAVDGKTGTDILSHAVMYRIERDRPPTPDSPPTFKFTVIDGANRADVYLDSSGRERMRDVQYTGLKLDTEMNENPQLCQGVLNNEFFQNLAATYSGAHTYNVDYSPQHVEKLYSLIEQSLSNPDLTNKGFGSEHGPQKGPTCFSKSHTLWFRGRTKHSFGLHFKYWETKKHLEKMFPKEKPSLWETIPEGREYLNIPFDILVETLKQTGDEIKRKRFTKAFMRIRSRGG